ncbi:Serine/threonine-protein kinase PK-1 [Enhygromyxa salina]|uniref:Serine/threonine-protein kinase PK-1 n=1 Tax=Enhygromyxa salina TaxID=215803 RepID=A0A2S9XHQ8_9BACT|nr:serine/threonine-protein kinase [Enhygromyxa salina]PRP92409.1 Serine/threonine-protein kinase PK-1 [Enhygromyxa salina]
MRVRSTWTGAALPSDPPSDDEVDDAELDRLAAGLERRDMPEDVAELMWAIAEKTFVRMGEPNAEPYLFEGFEALDTKFGGMGMVIEARDPQLDRKVAIKLWVSSGPEAEAALLAEAKLLAKLTHPNVVTVYETGQWNGRVYFVMEWVEGLDGHEWMQTPRDWRELRDVFAGAGAGLAAAHDAGVQHRDFKPANMLIGNDGRVLVADFGVAEKVRAFDSDDDHPAPLVGTPSYMAPERLRGERGDPRSDQFSFCVALWRGLHGQRPYPGDAPDELLEAIEAGAIRAGSPDSSVPHWLSRVVRKGLEYDAERRHRDMHELVRALLDEPDGGGEFSDGESDEKETLVPGEGLLNVPVAGKDQPRKAWQIFLYGSMTGIVLVMMVLLGLAIVRGQIERTFSADQPTPPQISESESESQRPEPADQAQQTETGDEDPFDAILQAIERGEFTEAHSSWLRERSVDGAPGLTDHESLAIGRASFERAVELRTTAPTGSDEAEFLAASIALYLKDSGDTADTRGAGERLGQDLEELRGAKAR